MSSERTPRETAAIEAFALTKRFEAPSVVEAVKSVSFAVCEGELTALVGPSGAGKSTLLGLLGGLQQPSSGKVRLRGRDFPELGSDDGARARNLEIGFVFQFHHLLPELTALENVALPALVAAREGWRPLSAEAVAERARGLLGVMGLRERCDHRPGQLSGGEAQRVSLARALVNEPAVILADEPTGNLDQHRATELMDLIQNLNREFRQAFLIATHNAELMGRASRVFGMKNGEMIT